MNLAAYLILLPFRLILCSPFWLAGTIFAWWFYVWTPEVWADVLRLDPVSLFGLLILSIVGVACFYSFGIAFILTFGSEKMIEELQ